MAEFLDINLPIGYIDQDKQIKATAYFEDLIYRIVESLGGEGSTLVSDLAAASLDMDKVPYLTGLVKDLSRQVNEIGNTINSPIIDAKLKSMQLKLNELEGHFAHHRLEAIVKSIDIRTSLFNTKVKTANYTAINRDFVEARNSITVKLPANPAPGDEVQVANGDGSGIKVDGNGSKIKYTTLADIFNIFRAGSSKHFYWFNDNVTSSGYWRAA